MEKKSFKITFGLKEGYDEDGKVHKIKDAGKLSGSGWWSERWQAYRF